jgi:hypothetical protein
MVTIEVAVQAYDELGTKLEHTNSVLEVIGLKSGECYVSFDGMILKKDGILKVLKILENLENSIHEYL